MSHSLVSSSVFIHPVPRTSLRCRSAHSPGLSASPLTLYLKGSHMGCRLNDNLDGTFTILPEKDAGPPVVASRMPMDVEEVVEPKRPTYPGASRKNVVWVNARAADETLARAQMETTPDPAPVLPPNSEERDWSSDTDLGHAADGRPYRQWWGEIWLSAAGCSIFFLTPQCVQMPVPGTLRA